MTITAQMGLLVLLVAQADVPRGELAAHVSRISPDFAVVTEVSSATPHVGEQFSIIYWLRAQHAPVAVDIDPQQFPSLWTEVVPVSTESGAGGRARPGYSEFLLRQVVAFPLAEGEAVLPGLSLKIKRTGSQSRRRDDWDLVATSESVHFRVLPVPDSGWVRGQLPLVGTLRGEMSPASADDPGRVILELESTANISWFQPGAWVRQAEGTPIRSRLLSSENQARIVDMRGRRRLSIVIRQRWSLEKVEGSAKGTRFDDLVVPVFDPEALEWIQVRIPGTWTGPRAPALPGRQVQDRHVPGAMPGQPWSHR